MYIIKNALKCIGRSKGRNILIGVIVLVIAVSSCIGLSIRQAAESARKETLESLSITATISFDRSSAMTQFQGGGGRDFDRNSFAEMMGEASSLSLEEYLIYADAPSVEDFYYSMTTYVNGSDDFLPVGAELEEDAEEDTEEAEPSDVPQDGFGGWQGGQGGFGGMMGGGDRVFGASSDFTIVGYSGESAMTAFWDGTAGILDGTIFTEGTASYECIITTELATYNYLSVGDTIQITNPNNEEELYSLTVTGIYWDDSANESSFSMFGATSNDPVNRIYVSYATLQAILDASATESAVTESGDRPLTGTLAGTYVFASVEDYEAFTEEIRTLGLSDSYTVSSPDVTAYENSLVPLDTLSAMAGYFLIVILVIGAVILVVLNIFNIRERKYEIGVLTAMGMKKGKVALQFLTEIFVVTLIAVVLGAVMGAFSSVPVTNALLENQVVSQNSRFDQVEQNFGRGEMQMGSGGMQMAPGHMQQGGSGNGFGNRWGNGSGNRWGNSAANGMENGGRNDFFSQMMGLDNPNAYVTEVSSAMNLTVALQMLGIGILLTLVSGMVSMLFVMRYEPLKILANRD